MQRIDVSIIVMNDRGYGVIKRIQDATGRAGASAPISRADSGNCGTRRHSVW